MTILCNIQHAQISRIKCANSAKKIPNFSKKIELILHKKYVKKMLKLRGKKLLKFRAKCALWKKLALGQGQQEIVNM